MTVIIRNNWRPSRNRKTRWTGTTRKTMNMARLINKRLTGQTSFCFFLLWQFILSFFFIPSSRNSYDVFLFWGVGGSTRWTHCVYNCTWTGICLLFDSKFQKWNLVFEPLRKTIRESGVKKKKKGGQITLKEKQVDNWKSKMFEKNRNEKRNKRKTRFKLTSFN